MRSGNAKNVAGDLGILLLIKNKDYNPLSIRIKKLPLQRNENKRADT